MSLVFPCLKEKDFSYISKWRNRQRTIAIAILTSPIPRILLTGDGVVLSESMSSRGREACSSGAGLAWSCVNMHSLIWGVAAECIII